MEDYRQRAIVYVHERFGQEYSLLEESVVDSERFYAFTFQANEFIQTGDLSFMTAGHGYTILNKEDGRWFSYGSRYSLTQAITLLTDQLSIEGRIRREKQNFNMQEEYALRIDRVKRRWKLVEILMKFEVCYVVPEITGDAIYRIEKKYDDVRLLHRLSAPPTVFHLINHSIDLIEALMNAKCCDFDLLLHSKRNFAKYASRATPEDLEPVW